ncbi:hypothetical protein Terro_3250 [Terriglobus roseus DSM 18391]|uniref:Uncharacterized protein n=1 Tax=Terriglobus roseus (strain DSM 18391 / NRRL B-41598 / KBS 63) TaxID=926566 RepID=I3ZJQ0_TERRK|nr:hypothetical protein [Terriglobus roseus]AFL89468.1 hypothetical protein Terro_3250 [Terriglobus roseus DSM 18391]
MRTTVDFDDALYADLKGKAASEQTSVKALITRAVYRMLHEAPQTRESEGKRRAWPTFCFAKGRVVEPVSNDTAIFGEPGTE